MTDESFQKLLDKVYRSRRRHDALVKKAEAEYERRYGKHPSEADDDMWIDFVNGFGPATTVKEVEKGAIEYANLERVRT